MYFEKISDIESIAKKNGTSIFVIPDEKIPKIKNAFIIKPEEKSVITIEQIRQITSKLNTKQTKEQFVIVTPTDKLNDESSNAFLKNLEEPNEKIHYILLTNEPSKLLPTILSRSSIYFLRPEKDKYEKINANEKNKELAKKIISAKPSELVIIAENITKNKTNSRKNALEMLETAIEILYKSYLITNKTVFLKKLPKFLSAYENISRNGHVKLHLIADLC